MVNIAGGLLFTAYACMRGEQIGNCSFGFEAPLSRDGRFKGEQMLHILLKVKNVFVRTKPSKRCKFGGDCRTTIFSSNIYIKLYRHLKSSLASNSSGMMCDRRAVYHGSARQQRALYTQQAAASMEHGTHNCLLERRRRSNQSQIRFCLRAEAQCYGEELRQHLL